MLLKDLCTPGVVCCSSGTHVLAAARLMRERHVGDLVVVDDLEDDQTPLGIVSDRDIVVEVLAKELDPRRMLVRDIMRAPAVIASEAEDASQALERMRAHGVRRLPVLGQDRKLVGIVTLDDLIARLAADLGTLAGVIDHERRDEQRQRR